VVDNSGYLSISVSEKGRFSRVLALLLNVNRSVNAFLALLKAFLNATASSLASAHAIIS
jgi:hypothetical protein